MSQRLSLFVVLLLAAGTIAAQPCSVEDLKGAYLFQTTGWAGTAALGIPGPDMSVPFAGLGIVAYDGKGKGNGKFVHALMGRLTNMEFVELTVTMGSNCQGEARFQIKDADSGAMLGKERHAMTLADDGHDVRSISVETGNGGMITSVQRRIDRLMPACTPDLIHGTYTMYYEGWLNSQMLNPSAPAYFMPAVGQGTFTIAERGSKGGGTHNFGGMIFNTELVSAAFTLREDCLGEAMLVARVKESNSQSPTKGPIVVWEGGNRMVVLAPPYSAFMSYTRESTR